MNKKDFKDMQRLFEIPVEDWRDNVLPSQMGFDGIWNEDAYENPDNQFIPHYERPIELVVKIIGWNQGCERCGKTGSHNYFFKADKVKTKGLRRRHLLCDICANQMQSEVERARQLKTERES